MAYAISGWRWRLRPLDKFVITVAGESGAGKSELASEIARLFTEEGFNTGVLQLDDYFVFPPKTNHEMRRRNLEQVGPYEVKLDFLNSNLRLIGLSFPPLNPTNSLISLADGYPAGSSEGRALLKSLFGAQPQMAEPLDPQLRYRILQTCGFPGVRFTCSYPYTYVTAQTTAT